MKSRTKYVRYDTSDSDKTDQPIVHGGPNDTLIHFLAELKMNMEKGSLNLNLKPNLLQKIEQMSESAVAVNKVDFYKNITDGLLSLLLGGNPKSAARIENTAEPVKIADDNFTIDGLPQLNGLIAEILEDKLPQGHAFLRVLKEEGEGLCEELNQIEIDFIGNVYDIINAIMLKLQSFKIPQKKYVYKVLAELVTKASNQYQFISSEDFDFVETKYHQIEEGVGQRIQNGLSFIVLDKTTAEVIKYGKVKVG
ncbi:MAG: hypothetical protein GQ574_27470 [Crocinitomix sp.]|nr:hypothetical protein [Crocinitomix sp.]